MNLSGARTLFQSLVQHPSFPEANMDAIINSYYLMMMGETRRGISTLESLTAVWTTAQGAKTASVGGGADEQAADFISVYRWAANNSDLGPEMEWLPLEEIIRLQNDQTTQAAPTHWHADRYDKGVSDTNPTPIHVRLWVWPIPDATYWYSAKVVRNGILLNGGSANIEMAEEDAQMMVRRAAAYGATLVGRPPELIERIRHAPFEELARERARKIVPIRGEYKEVVG